MLLDDRYRATDFLGAGGMGRNFLAVDEKTPSKKRCVIKQFSPHSNIVSNPTAFAKAIELFNREAAMLDRLGDESPQIPRLLAYLEQDKTLYFVQEFIDGQNLFQELEQKGTYNEAQTCQLLKDLLPLLKFIHEKGVIHRDIKPENIMRRQNGQLVLIDFGISKKLSGTVSSLGTTVGTLGYAPPEQMTHGVAYPASDIYALGVTCIHLMTNIFPDKLFYTQENRWLWRDVLTSNRVDISQQLRQVLEKMLAADVRQRYKSVDEVVKDLNPLMVGIWYGEFDNAPASLTITHQSGNSFSGVLTVQYSKGLSRIEIKGDLDHKTNNLNIGEIRVLSEPKRGVWVLGKNKGQLSSNKKQISGTGEGYGSYSWSFSKAEVNDEIWYGEFDKKAASMVLHRRSDNSFDGTLTVKEWLGQNKIGIEVTIISNLNKIRIKEISVLPGSVGWWTLVENNEGFLSPDGKKMSGHGKGNSSYSWSFSKEYWADYEKRENSNK
ncbi:serine/threonine-protein kinase [Argonema galeatum]|uniref:serine/threonine-protein kinase n=1 Tax=Argonema galeatum TaxID=2942762 RepID=UPI0020136EB0|nr:serine/threonine-protein kinase [Argonema galeatum]MCL1468706.1 serine/threonine protein kinase [Argonema galeatum A003/A1]